MPKKKPDFMVPVWGPTQQPIHRWHEVHFKTPGWKTEPRVHIPGDKVPGSGPGKNYVHESELDYIPNEARYEQVEIGVSNSFGFGGHNACLVFRRWHDEQGEASAAPQG